jgi:hypothetical protein
MFSSECVNLPGGSNVGHAEVGCSGVIGDLPCEGACCEFKGVG